MKTADIREHFRRNGWLLAALGICVAACLMLGVLGRSSTSEDERVSKVLSAMAGAGQVRLSIHYDTQSVPCGALVLAEGAGDVGVRLRLIAAVSTLLGLDPANVAVYSLEGGTP